MIRKQAKPLAPLAVNEIPRANTGMRQFILREVRRFHKQGLPVDDELLREAGIGKEHVDPCHTPPK